MADFDCETVEKQLAWRVMDLKIDRDGMTIRELIRKYRAGELVDIVRCTDCVDASVCPIGNKPIAEKMACKDGVRKGSTLKQGKHMKHDEMKLRLVNMNRDDKVYCLMMGDRLRGYGVKKGDIYIGRYGFVFVYGGPGPDAERYFYDDYGKTWAFAKNEIDIPTGQEAETINRRENRSENDRA